MGNESSPQNSLSPPVTFRRCKRSRSSECAVRPRSVVRFNLFDQMMHAAVAGQGIALGRSQFIRPMLDDDRLVRLATPHAGPKSNKCYFLLQRDPKPSREVQALVDWIVAEARLTDRIHCA